MSDEYLPCFYDTTLMTETQAFSRGLHQGTLGHGPFGIYHSLEDNPTPEIARLVSMWLRGWSKGRTLFLEQQNETSTH